MPRCSSATGRTTYWLSLWRWLSSADSTSLWYGMYMILIICCTSFLMPISFTCLQTSLFFFLSGEVSMFLLGLLPLLHRSYPCRVFRLSVCRLSCLLTSGLRGHQLTASALCAERFFRGLLSSDFSPVLIFLSTFTLSSWVIRLCIFIITS